MTSKGHYGSGESYYANLFPHFVLEGRRHIDPNEKAIFEISFVIEDAAQLFYDFDAFGSVIDSGPYINQIANANKLDRPIPIGSEPQIAYFAGNRIIIEADTVLGKVSARHNPSWGMGGPHGVRIDNTISVNIETETPIVFDEAIHRTSRLLRFLELIIGRPQNISEVIVYVDGDKHREPLLMHWSFCPSRETEASDEKMKPHPADLLLDPIRRQEEFSSVMRGWLENDEERNDARYQFQSSFAKQRSYSVERIVSAANMFDILPKSAVPRDIQLPEELQNAKNRCQEIFGSLPISYERDSVLNTLGRVGKASLKHKTRHRAQYIISSTGWRFPDLLMVLDEAIDCRNHYVHGSSSKIDYNRNFDAVTFFTDTLEFVFAASELTEAGWDIRAFMEKPTSMSHPFAEYKINYNMRLKELKALRCSP